MKYPIALLLLIAILLSSCTGAAWRKAFTAPSITLSYDDFGPERIASQLLGPRGSSSMVIAHHGFNHITPSAETGIRYVNVQQSMFFLTRQVRALAFTPENEPLRQRLRSTYARLYPLHRTRRDGMIAGAFISPRGGMSRMLMLPSAMPPSI